ncbi:MAG: helix-turn-helix domain-containing protein [Dehalococcoidia bacterium]|nr:helix-turn-helix domain-containing protein [Dehalococcoidia bacterium]
MSRPVDEYEAEQRARELLLAEHPDIREQYESLRPRFEVVSALIRARKEAGLTQAQLAERMGRRQSLISAIESGRRNPHFQTLADAARALGYELRVDFVRAPNPDGGASRGGGDRS